MSDNLASSHIVLIGMMGSGKTTTGRAIASRLDRPLRDCDAELEAREGRTGGEIAASHGVNRLHELEEDVFLDALAGRIPAVIAAAGWVVESPRCRRAMSERAVVVWLDAPIETVLERMVTSDHRRALSRSEAQVLLDRRSTWFAELSDLHLDAVEPPEQLVERVVSYMATVD